MKTKDRRTTGVTGLDFPLDGGFPTGTSIIVYGHPLSGVDLMAKQFWKPESDESKEEGIYLVLDEDPESGMVEAAASALGWERIVYGSDVTGRHFAVQMGKTLGTDLPDAVKKDILWNNAARLMPAWAGVKPLEGGAA